MITADVVLAAALVEVAEAVPAEEPVADAAEVVLSVEAIAGEAEVVLAAEAIVDVLVAGEEDPEDEAA